MKEIEVTIHTGSLSVDNGARGPLTMYFALAKLLKVEALVGEHYGYDRLCISEADWPVAKDLLDEACMLYKVQGTHDRWQNVRTTEVQARLAHLPWH